MWLGYEIQQQHQQKWCMNERLRLVMYYCSPFNCKRKLIGWSETLHFYGDENGWIIHRGLTYSVKLFERNPNVTVRRH